MNTIPETPNTHNEPTWTIAQAVHALGLRLPLAELSKLGRECSSVARIWSRPTTVVPVTGQRWTSEKAYTRDVLEEVFRLNPSTKAAFIAQRAAQQTAALAREVSP